MNAVGIDVSKGKSTVAIMRPVLAFVAVYILGTVIGKQEIALIGCWSAALIDMITRMILMLKRYKGGKWHDIKVLNQR